MLESIFGFILDMFFWLIKLIGSIIILPLQTILTALIPNLDNYLDTFMSFLNNYVFHYLSFFKELFLDITCLPRPLWTLLITFIFTKWLIAPAIRGILLIINLWKLKSGGTTK